MQKITEIGTVVPFDQSLVISCMFSTQTAFLSSLIAFHVLVHLRKGKLEQGELLVLDFFQEKKLISKSKLFLLNVFEDSGVSSWAVAGIMSLCKII